MFIIIKHGDGSSLFSPDCSMVQLAVNIRRRCQCLSPEVGIALATDKCDIIHLSPEDCLENASHLFTNRASYTLLAVHYKDSESPQYEAISEKVDYDLAVKLDLLSNPNSVQYQNKWNRIHRKYTKTSIPPTSVAKTTKKTASKNKITT